MILDPIKPYIHLVEAAAVALLLAAAGFGVWHYGHTRYEEGRADDHKGWDADRAQWQHALDQQKIDAAMLLSTTIAQNDALRRANQVLHEQQEKDYANHRAETDALHAQLSTVRLRFNLAPAPAGRGQGGAGPVPGPAGKAGLATDPAGFLSAEASQSLWSIVYDADKLRDAYARCVAAVNGGPSL